jgi:hypothetical protein
MCSNSLDVCCNIQLQLVYTCLNTQDAWLPLQGNSSSGSSGGGGLGCNWCTVSVLSLAWNDKDQILYIGGKFNMVDRYHLLCTSSICDCFIAAI